MTKTMKRHSAVRTCPLCGKSYIGVPAMSRIDNKPICQDCGTRQALQSIGVEAEEQEKIIQIIHDHTKEATS